MALCSQMPGVSSAINYRPLVTGVGQVKGKKRVIKRNKDAYTGKEKF